MRAGTSGWCGRSFEFDGWRWVVHAWWVPPLLRPAAIAAWLRQHDAVHAMRRRATPRHGPEGDWAGRRTTTACGRPGAMPPTCRRRQSRQVRCRASAAGAWCACDVERANGSERAQRGHAVRSVPDCLWIRVVASGTGCIRCTEVGRRRGKVVAMTVLDRILICPCLQYRGSRSRIDNSSPDLALGRCQSRHTQDSADSARSRGLRRLTTTSICRYFAISPPH
ncbi:MAG: hypothetical protein JWM86_656 [Thermoleophilia bacterium]|nr:hypothetical protein [Thermoleophilia bacterium]